MNKLLFLTAVLASSPLRCMAANLRASSSSGSASSSKGNSDTATAVFDNDLVDASAYLVVQVDGYDMDDLARISPKKKAVIDCALHKAFDEIHGDRDGLYMSGQQILATEEVHEDSEDNPGDIIHSGIELGKRPYVYRPRKFPKKPRVPKPIPPPRLPEGSWKKKKKYNIYWRLDTTGLCNMCPDDDSMGVASNSLLLNTNDNKNQIASDFVMSEASVNAIADALRKHLIEGTCVIKGGNDDSFEFVQKTDIFVLSQTDFEDAVAAITAYKEAKGKDDARAGSVAATDLESSPSASATSILPYYYGGSSSTSLDAAAAAAATTSTNSFFKIGLSGVDCGPWGNEDLLDMNSGLHDSINSMGFTDKGHVIDKIVGGRNFRKPMRRFVWKCHYDVYTKLDLAGNVLDDASLDDIGDALCDDLIQYGGNQKFRNVIDCQLAPLSATDYGTMVATSTASKKAGLPVSTAQE